MDPKPENLTEIRRDFHRFPELGFQEKRTKDKIARYLEVHKILADEKYIEI